VSSEPAAGSARVLGAHYEREDVVGRPKKLQRVDQVSGSTETLPKKRNRGPERKVIYQPGG